MPHLTCCDLLEKSYLCGINNNAVLCCFVCAVVVICLKSLTFVVSITTSKLCTSQILCCDLLEKSYLCGINNNVLEEGATWTAVVICLKSLTFVVSITTFTKRNTRVISCDLLEKSYLCGINNNTYT